MSKVELQGVFEERTLSDVLLKPNGLVQTKHTKVVTGPNNLQFVEVEVQNYNAGDPVPVEIASFVKGFSFTTDKAPSD